MLTPREEAFAVLAKVYSHELYKAYPDEFWEYFHRELPNVSREDMIRLLNMTRSKEVPCP